jgi:hypothetical protein
MKYSKVKRSRIKTSHKKVHKKDKLDKENFQPEFSELNMTLKEAYRQVVKMQRKLSVVIQKLLPRDIKSRIECLPYTNRNLNEIDQNDPKLSIIKGIIKINQHMENLAASKAARIVAVHRVVTNKGCKSSGITKDYHPLKNDEYVRLVINLIEIIRNPSSYQTTPLDRIYLLNKTDIYSNIPPPSKDNDTFSKEKNLILERRLNSGG